MYAGTGECETFTVNYSINSMNDTSCCVNDCKIEAIDIMCINFTFLCLNITRTEFTYSGIISLRYHFNINETMDCNISANNQDEMCQFFQCTTMLQVTFPMAISEVTVTFHQPNGKCLATSNRIAEITILPIIEISTTPKKNEMTTTPLPHSNGIGEITSTLEVTGTTKTTASETTMSNLGVTTSTKTTASETTRISQEGSPPPPGIASAIIGSSVAIGFLLLLVILAILVLLCVLLGKKKKSHILDISQFTTAENNYSVVDTRLLPALPSSNEETNIERITDPMITAERNPQNLGEYSLPVPPLEPELIPLELWRQEAENSPLHNPYYASTAALSEPPDYESIQDIRRNYILPQIDPLEKEPSRLDSLERNRSRKEINKMSLLPEEDRHIGEESTLTLTAENCIYGSDMDAFGYTAENSLYQSEQAALLHESSTTRNPNTFMRSSSDKKDHNNDSESVTAEKGQYEALREGVAVSEKVNSFSHLSTELKLGSRPDVSTNAPPALAQTDSPSIMEVDTQDSEVPTENVPRSNSKEPPYSKVNLIEKRRRRNMASGIDENCSHPDPLDSDDTNTPPCIPSYNHNLDGGHMLPHVSLPYHPDAGSSAPCSMVGKEEVSTELTLNSEKDEIAINHPALSVYEDDCEDPVCHPTVVEEEAQ